MTVSSRTTRTETSGSPAAPLWNGKPDWLGCLLFVAMFALSHFAFCAFIALRDIALNRKPDGEGLLSFVIFIFWGPLMGVESAIGYMLVDTVTSIGRASSNRLRRLSAVLGGVVTYVLIGIVVTIRTYVPELAANVIDSPMNFRVIPWGVSFLGGVSALVSLAARQLFNKLPSGTGIREQKPPMAAG